MVACLCEYVSAHARMLACAYECACVCVGVYVHVYVCTCKYALMSMCERVYVCGCTRGYVN